MMTSSNRATTTNPIEVFFSLLLFLYLAYYGLDFVSFYFEVMLQLN